MKEIVEFIAEKLGKYRIKMDVKSKVEELVVSNKVNEFMMPSSIYTVFLLHLSKDDEMYKAILNDTYLFDLEVEICDKKNLYEEDRLRRRVVEIYDERAQYVYVSTSENVHFVGIKLNRKGYAPITNYNDEEDTIPYFLLVDGLKKDFSMKDFTWNEIVFGFRPGENEKSKYVEVLESVKAMRLPVSIVDDDAMHIETAATNVHTCYIHCGSHENWPEDQGALDCAKTALYCLIHKKSKYRCAVGYDYVLLKYKGSYFRFQIIIKRDRKAEFRINSKISEIVGQQPGVFRKNVISVKRFLDSHGYFPMHFDDRLVELMCLMFGRNILSFGKFFNEFLDHKISLEGYSFNLETFKLTENRSKRFEVVYQHDLVSIGIPPRKIIQRLNSLKKLIRMQKQVLFDKNFKLQTYKLQQPSFKDYDFVLSLKHMPGFIEVGNQEPTPFLLGAPLMEEALPMNLRSKAYFFYSPGRSVLMVKVKEGVDPWELLHVLILKTAFRYYLKNF